MSVEPKNGWEFSVFTEDRRAAYRQCWGLLQQRRGNHALYSCGVCSQLYPRHYSPMVECEARTAHEKDDHHQLHVDAYLEAKSAFLRKVSQAKEVHRRTKEAGLYYPATIAANLFYYVFESRDERQYLEKANQLLERAIVVEPLVVLELAVWRAACLLHPPMPLKDLSDHIAWIDHGWKAEKARRRHDAMVEVVLKNVAPFFLESK